VVLENSQQKEEWCSSLEAGHLGSMVIYRLVECPKETREHMFFSKMDKSQVEQKSKFSVPKSKLNPFSKLKKNIPMVESV
jgi:hypothetical protein